MTTSTKPRRTRNKVTYCTGCQKRTERKSGLCTTCDPGPHALLGGAWKRVGLTWEFIPHTKV